MGSAESRWRRLREADEMLILSVRSHSLRVAAVQNNAFDKKCEAEFFSLGSEKFTTSSNPVSWVHLDGALTLRHKDAQTLTPSCDLSSALQRERFQTSFLTK